MNKKEEKRIVPELLAPAGNKEAFIAAVESGADAIYLGGEILNARMSAGNFSLPEMKEAIEFAHKRHVKVYVTVNTLVRDDEMEDALNYCRALYDINADALIIQDLGLGYLVRREMPDFPIHLSTQGSIYDLSGVETAGSLGYERVVLARELSLEEIKHICESTDVEVEVFSHGALCICYSGQCQMSRAIGARSGNRGACAQPCRLAYEMKTGKGWSNKGFYLSPADLCLLDYLGELSDAGVSSIKIEGRMKSPEYVSVVISTYRKYLDQYRENGSYVVSEEDREALTQIFNRGFTTGYINGSYDEFMSGDKPKNKGILVGEVMDVTGIKGKKDRSIISARLKKSIDKNDILEIGDSAHCTVTLLEENHPYVRIGDVVGDVNKGDAIYRVVSDKQIKAAELTYKNKDWHEGKFARKTALACDVISTKDGMIKVIMRDLVSGGIVNEEEGPFDLSDTSVGNRIIESLKKTGGTPFVVEKINLRGDFNYSIPVSKLNEVRRNALEKMEALLCATNRKDMKCNRYVFDEKGERKHKRILEVFFYNAETFLFDEREVLIELSKADIDELRVLIPAAGLIDCMDEVIERASKLNVRVIPYISNISKGRENKIVEENFYAILEFAKERGIYIGNLNWIKRFVDNGVKVFGDYGLNKYNEWTSKALETIGVEYVTDSIEKLEVGGGEYGRAPLMTSEHRLDGSEIRDRKGVEYDVIKRSYSDQDIISVHAAKGMRDILVSGLKKVSPEGETVRVYM